jgi:hypothetical protein
MQILEPQIQVRKNCLVYYNLPTVRPGRAHKPIKKKAYSGQVTAANVKRLKSALDILLQITPTRTTYNPVTKKYFPFQLNFVTMTVSARKNISAKEGYHNLMRPFLRKLQKEGSYSYLWKAELQKRGQLHYHLVTDTFFTWQLIRSTWNNLQRRHRYLDDYAKQTGHFDANSTDVHALNGVGNVGAYLAKYLGKSNNATIKGKIWDCSTNLKRKRFAFTPTNTQEMQLRELQNDNQIKVIELEHCTIFKTKKPLQLLTSKQYLDYLQWI